MGVADYPSPRYAPVHFSPSRGAKRSRSATLGSGEDGSVPAIRTRGLAGHYPTPPLSSSSSASSGSASSASTGHFLSFASCQWNPGFVGPPMKVHDSPMGYATPAPDLDLDAAMLSHMHSAEHALHEPPSQPPMPNSIPLHPLDGNRLAPTRPLDPSALPPNAPDLEHQQLQVNPTLDQLKPWQQQEYVEGLIGVAMLAIDSIWPPVAPATPDSCSSPGAEVLPLKYFIQETLRRSRSSATVLQVALYYLHKARRSIRDRVAKAEKAKECFTQLARARQQPSSGNPYPTPPSSPLLDEFTAAAAEVLATSKDPVICGRRMFLASLITASKFLMDRTYSNRAWSRLSGLPVAEINANERAFLKLLDYKLYIGADLMTNWQVRLRKLQEQQGIVSPKLKRMERTHSDTLMHHQLPMSEMCAGRADRVVPAIPSSLSSKHRSQSTANIPAHFPQAINVHPRAGEGHTKAPLQPSATLGLSRSNSMRMPHSNYGSDFAPSPQRWSPALTKHRSCSSATSLGGMGPDQHSMPMQAAY